MSMEAFFAMGGYAFYVWTAYAVCFVVLLANLVLPVVKRKRLLRDLALKHKRQRR